VTVERIAGDIEADVFGQDDRKLIAGNANRAA
jgi:hypothetical protein